jgi:deoxycytidylate deaminase
MLNFSAIIQSGIKKIFVHKQFYKLSTTIKRENWVGHDDITMQMFDEANVELVMLDLPNLKADAYLDGLVYNLGC